MATPHVAGLAAMTIGTNHKCYSDMKIDSINRISRNVYKVTVTKEISIESMQETADKCSIVKLV